MKVLGVQPSELLKMGKMYRFGLVKAAQELKSRDQFEFVCLIGLALSKPDSQTREQMVKLAMAAYESDPESQAKAVHSICTEGT